jgi:hypothetical protein
MGPRDGSPGDQRVVHLDGVRARVVGRPPTFHDDQRGPRVDRRSDEGVRVVLLPAKRHEGSAGHDGATVGRHPVGHAPFGAAHHATAGRLRHAARVHGGTVRADGRRHG